MALTWSGSSTREPGARSSLSLCRKLSTTKPPVCTKRRQPDCRLDRKASKRACVNRGGSELSRIILPEFFASRFGIAQQKIPAFWRGSDAIKTHDGNLIHVAQVFTEEYEGNDEKNFSCFDDVGGLCEVRPAGHPQSLYANESDV